MNSLRNELKELIEQKGTRLIDAWIGPDDIKEQILAVIHSGRHLLLEGPVGSGKTLIAKELSNKLPDMEIRDCGFNCYPESPECPQCETQEDAPIITIPGHKRFVRVQGSPELTAEDLVGDIDPVVAFKWGPFDPRAFKPGKIIKAHRKILFIDEINRLSERLQNTLLQVLQEHVITIGNFDVEFDVDLVLIATMNPAEYAGVERISEALKDRLERVRITYPTAEEELEIVQRYGVKTDKEIPLKLAQEIVKIIQRTRTEKDIENAASVRATLSTWSLSQSFATMRKDLTVTADDVRKAVNVALRGRVSLAPESPYFEHPAEYVRSLIDNVLNK
jgi:Mg-chelatase subunit ChlI